MYSVVESLNILLSSGRAKQRRTVGEGCGHRDGDARAAGNHRQVQGYTGGRHGVRMPKGNRPI